MGDLQNYRKQDFPFNNISLKQFRNGVLGFWDFTSAYAPDLSAFSTKIYAICINTASVERLFSSMGFFIRIKETAWVYEFLNTLNFYFLSFF